MASAEEFIRLLQENAEGLRRAGVKSFSVDGCSVELLPQEMSPEDLARAIAEASASSEGVSHVHPLNDPMTFGGPNVQVPGFDRQNYGAGAGDQ